MSILATTRPLASWHACGRCGIEVGIPGWCDDCCDVEGVPRLNQFIPAPSTAEIRSLVGRRYAKNGSLIIRGARNGNRGLTSQEVRELYARTDAGESAVQIAYMLRVTTKTVNRHRANRAAFEAAEAAATTEASAA